MALADVTRDGVLKAMAEFEELGHDAFLERYGFGPSTGYTLVYQGRQYDSKAIVGVAHKFDRPSEGVLGPKGLSGGKDGAAGRLKALDFEVEQRPWDPDYSREPSAWVIRAGREGEAEELALAESCAVTGWSEVGELSAAMTRDDLKAAIETAYDDHSRAKLNSGAGRLFRFVNDVVEGDVVVLPLQTSVGEVAVGRVTGPYRYRPQFLDRDAVNTRAVDWFAPAVARDKFPEELRSALSRQGAISRISQPDAVNRLAAVAEGDTSGPGSWLFQANLKAWDLRGALANLPTLQWVARQSPLKLKVGDRVHFWLSGARGGVLGRGHLLTSPTIEQENSSDAAFDLEGGFRKEERRVWVAVDRVLDQPLGREELRDDSLLGGLPIFRFANATNFDLDPALDLALMDLEDDRDGRDVVREKLFFITASNDLARAHLQTSLVDGVPLERLSALTEIHGDLQRHAVDGRVYAWGARPGDRGEKKWERLAPGDVCLIYTEGGFRYWARVYAKVRSEATAREIWEEHNGEIWECMYFLSPVARLDASLANVVEVLGYKENFVPQGFEIPGQDVQDALLERYPTLLHLISRLGGEGVYQDDDAGGAMLEPTLDEIVKQIEDAGLRLDPQTIRRYHLSLKTRGFVVLSGLSGSGKTWLAQLYAEAVGAKSLLVPVAPNWTANEDLLGSYDPLAKEYRHTPFSRFLQEAAAAWSEAQSSGGAAQPYHLILDEMNLARVEYYFAKFLSAMEIRARDGEARLELDGDTVTALTPNLMFAGTVNIDETTHGFADKVYDRAQLIEVPVIEAGIAQHLTGSPHAEPVLEVWRAMRPIAPFAYRVLDEIAAYVDEAEKLAVATDIALDEQLVQKVLPKIRGTDPRIGDALSRFIELAEPSWPLSTAKAKAMSQMFATHGFTSYYEA